MDKEIWSSKIPPQSGETTVGSTNLTRNGNGNNLLDGTGAIAAPKHYKQENNCDINQRLQQDVSAAVSDKDRYKIQQILDQVNTLKPVEKLLLYLKLPTESSSTVDPLRQPLNPLGSRSEISQTIMWIKTHLEEDQDISLQKKAVYDEYKSYCDINQIKALSTADFGKVMKQVYPMVKPRRLGIRGQSQYCYSGLRNRVKLITPVLPDLSDNQISSELPFSQPELLSAAWTIINEWCELNFKKQFKTLPSLAYFLVVTYSICSGSTAANLITTAANSQPNGDMINTLYVNKHRETTLQLQRKLQQKHEVKEQKRKIQSPRSDNGRSASRCKRSKSNPGQSTHTSGLTTPQSCSSSPVDGIAPSTATSTAASSKCNSPQSLSQEVPAAVTTSSAPSAICDTTTNNNSGTSNSTAASTNFNNTSVLQPHAALPDFSCSFNRPPASQAAPTTAGVVNNGNAAAAAAAAAKVTVVSPVLPAATVVLSQGNTGTGGRGGVTPVTGVTILQQDGVGNGVKVAIPRLIKHSPVLSSHGGSIITIGTHNPPKAASHHHPQHTTPTKHQSRGLHSATNHHHSTATSVTSVVSNRPQQQSQYKYKAIQPKPDPEMATTTHSNNNSDNTATYNNSNLSLSSSNSMATFVVNPQQQQQQQPVQTNTTTTAAVMRSHRKQNVPQALLGHLQQQLQVPLQPDVPSSGVVQQGGGRSSDRKRDISIILEEDEQTVLLSRERLNSICTVSKEDLDDYLCTSNSQEQPEEEIMNYFSNNNNNDVQQPATDANLSHLRQLLTESKLSEQQTLHHSTLKQPSNHNTPIHHPKQHKVQQPQHTNNHTVTSSTLNARRRVSFETGSSHTHVTEDSVPPSPNTRRKQFNFTPISTSGEMSPTGVNSKCSSTNASPFVSPRNTPVPRARGNSHPHLTSNPPVKKPKLLINPKLEVDVNVTQDLSLNRGQMTTNLPMSAPPSPKNPINTPFLTDFNPQFEHTTVGFTPDNSLASTELYLDQQKQVTFRSQSVPVAPNYHEVSFANEFENQSYEIDTRSIIDSINTTNYINDSDLFGVLPAELDKATARQINRSQSIEVASSSSDCFNNGLMKYPSRSVPSTPVPYSVIKSEMKSYPCTPSMLVSSNSPTSFDFLVNGERIKEKLLPEIGEGLEEFGTAAGDNTADIFDSINYNTDTELIDNKSNLNFDEAIAENSGMVLNKFQ